VLAYLLAGELLLRFVMERGGELGDRVAKTGVAE
jgi:hypothetical protein